jgi:uncharacterized membrane protein
MIRADFGSEITAMILGIPPVTFWPYFAGGVVLVIGLACLPKKELGSARSLDKLVWFGPLLLAIAIAIFGADHFVTPKAVATIVPQWMPWRLFWAYFVGAALVAAGLSFATKVYWRLAAAMFGIMLFLFVLMMHIPNLFLFPKSSALVHNLVLRDTAIGSGPIAFGLSLSGFTNKRREGVSAANAWRSRLIAVMRFLLAVPVAIFGILHFEIPARAPGIPSISPFILNSLPALGRVHGAFSYATGVMFLCCAAGLVVKRYARTAAKALAVTMLVITLLVYVPLTIVKASDVGSGLNFLAISFALAGSALMLAQALGTPTGAVTEAGENDATRIPVTTTAA